MWKDDIAKLLQMFKCGSVQNTVDDWGGEGLCLFLVHNIFYQVIPVTISWISSTTFDSVSFRSVY